MTFVSQRMADKALQELIGIEMFGRPLRAQQVEKKKAKGKAGAEVAGGEQQEQAQNH